MSAEDLIAERRKTHGDFSRTADTADTLVAFLRNRAQHASADQRHALDMIAVKIARILHGDPDCDDHWRDIAGYATLVADRIDQRRN